VETDRQKTIEMLFLIHPANGDLLAMKKLMAKILIFVDKPQIHGLTAIQIARNNGHADMVEYLISSP